MIHTPKFFILLLSIFIANITLADTFTVTSNADSGPGTLREAIEKANGNGTAVIDYINFNITDLTPTGRTIVLQSYLPGLTSNIVLDATTQPGAKFGVNDAKIHVTTNGSETYSRCFILNGVKDIEIYGFYITEFRYGDPNKPDTWRCAIWMDGIVENIKIGAPGKGNVFFNNALAICTPYGYSRNEGHHFSNITIQSNFFNLDTDGITYTRFDAWTCIVISSFTNITIGGDDPVDGNYFAGLNGDAANLICDDQTGNGVLNVKNNTFGSTFDKTTSVPCGALGISGYEFYAGQGGQIFADLVVNIVDNTFRNPATGMFNNCHGMVGISSIYGFIKFTGNIIGTPLGTYPECQTSGISIGGCKDGMIGGENPEDQNIIASNDYAGIVLYDNRNITVKKNSIYCNGKGIEAKSTFVDIPEVKIMTTNNVDYIAGTATPNCTIEVFQTINRCYFCNNGETYMGKTTSDASGNWSFTGIFTGPVTARATSATGATGEFSAAKFVQALDYQGPVCGKNNGFIKGSQFVSGTKYYWIRYYNGQTDTIFNSLDLTDIGPGRYDFVVEQTKYCSVSYTIQLSDVSPQIYTQYGSIYDPSCGQSNGMIVDIGATGIYDKLYWLSDNRDTVGFTEDLINVPEGKYKLIALNQEYGCGDSTSYYSLINQSGPTLVYDKLEIKHSYCNNPNGSIIGITVKNYIGSTYVQWLDSTNNVIGYEFNLTNQPAGKYRLKYKDDSGCDTITTPFFVIPSLGNITIDTTGKNIISAGCTKANGGIGNLSVNGADTWVWKNTDDNTVVGNSVNVSLLKAGNYQLTATNQYNCSVTSPVISIPLAAFAAITPANPVASNAACGQNNGVIKLDGFTNANALASYQWIKGVTNESLGSQMSITGLGEGNYKLIATDTNGCVKTIYSADITVGAKPQIDKSDIQVVNDRCSLKEASINGLQIRGSSNTPTYTWTDGNGMLVSTSLDIKNIGEGNYQLTVKDGAFCVITGETIHVTNDNSDPLPQYDDLIIPRNTATTLKVNNSSEGTYFLYADPAGNQLIEENTTGIFNTPVLNADRIFYVKHINGGCVSQAKQIKITVVDKSEFAVPTAFTPNRDGLNEVLHVKVLGYINLEYFRIFNRFGKEVFFSKKLTDGWDGRVNGREQPSGVFIWMARGKDLLGNTVESKGTIMLIR